jgi:PilZ domain
MADPHKGHEFELKESGGRSKRRKPRRAFSAPVGVLCGGQFEVVRATQLSEGGIGFTSKTPYQVSAKAVFSFLIPDGGAVVVRGEIAQIDKHAGSIHYGVKFLSVNLQLRRVIRNYVAAKTEAEAELETSADFLDFRKA